MIRLTVVEYQANCYIINSGKSAYVIDPGGDCGKIVSALDQNGLTDIKIINTHSHIDHWFCNAALKEKYNAEILLSEQGEKLCFDSRYNLSEFAGGMDFTPMILILAIIFLQSFLVPTLKTMAVSLG